MENKDNKVMSLNSEGISLNLDTHSKKNTEEYTIRFENATVGVTAEQDLDTFMLTYKVTYMPFNNGRKITLRYANISQLANFKADLCNRGIAVECLDSNELHDLFEKVTKDTSKLDTTYTHRMIGWNYYGADRDNEGLLGFGYDKAIFTYEGTKNSTCENMMLKQRSLNREISIIASKGTIENYIKGFSKLVVPYKQLLTVYMIGLVGIISQLLEDRQYNLIANIFGKTTSGKSTLLSLVLSAFGNPQELFNNNNMTNCGKEDLFSSYQPIPCVLDETLRGTDSLSEKQYKEVIRNLIFNFSSGKIRGGSGKHARNMRNKVSDNYYTTLLLSTEKSIFKLLGNDESEGQLYRMFEITPKPGCFIQDGKHATEITQLVSENHGLIIPYLVKFMINEDMTPELIRAKIYEKSNYVTEDPLLQNVHGSDRIAKKIAAVLVVSDIFKNCFGADYGIDYDSDDIKDILIESFLTSLGEVQTKKQDMDLICKTKYKELYNLYRENADMFADDNKDYNPIQHIGIAKNVNNVLEVSLVSNRLRMVLSGCSAEEILCENTKKELINPSLQKHILKYWDDNWDPESPENKGLHRESSNSRGLTHKIDVYYNGMHQEENGYTIKLDHEHAMNYSQAA